MKLHTFCGLLMYSAYSLQAIENAGDIQAASQNPSIQVIINSHSQSNPALENNIDQTAHQKSIQATNIEDQYKQNSTGRLEPDTSVTKYVIWNGLKASCGALIIGTCPSLFIPYYVNRLIIYPLLADDPFFESISEEEKEEFIKKNLQKVPYPVMYPVVYTIRKRLTNWIYTKEPSPQDEA